MSKTLSVAEKSALRSNIYAAIEDMLNEADGLEILSTEPIATGLLAMIDGAAVEVRVIVKDEKKFDLADVRAKYQEKLQLAAERAEKHAEVEARKAAKAAEKLAKVEKTEG